VKPDRMPKFRCHKEVWALKIASICETAGCLGAVLTSADIGYGPVQVDCAYINRHKPYVGGYYVVYEDGYESFSPAKAFEDGYTRI
jgi:cytochrome oxidase assembly protein ShyY1